MIFGDIVALAKAGWSFKDVRTALEMVETSPKIQEAKTEDAQKANEEIKANELMEQLKNVETNANDPEVNLGAFAKLAKEE